ncbi:MAG: YwaF family protein [Oscillospiraceae bacterium]|nr:YwaF family protein [Oscillospiraceae bacterium]
MFSLNHFIWIGISVVLFVVAIVFLRKYRPPLKNVLTVCCVIAVLSEITKVLSMIKLVPSSDGSMMTPYLELNQLPFNLCSIQIIFIFIARLTGSEKLRKTVLGFMYPTCIAGAIGAILLPTIFTFSITSDQAFTHPLGYQFFLYHTMLVTLGVYIPMSGEARFGRRQYATTMGIFYAIGFSSIYINSLCASPTYIDGELVSVDFATNYFVTGSQDWMMTFTDINQWRLYFLAIVIAAAAVITILYIPYLRKPKA